MADMVMLETRLPEAVDDRLAEIALEDGRTKAVLMADMLRHCVIDHPQWTTEAAEDMRVPREGTRVLRVAGALDPLAHDVGERLREVAASAAVDAGGLLVQVLANMLGIDLDEMEAIEAGLRDIEEGRVYEHADVMAHIERMLAPGK